MACHLDGGICPHDWGIRGGSDYITSGSSSYGRMSSYAAAPNYTGKNVALGSYAGSSSNAGYGSLQNSNSHGLASYAANPKYGAAYNSAMQYMGKSSTEKKIKGPKAAIPFSQYQSNAVPNRENKQEQEQQFVVQDRARLAPTIDDAITLATTIAAQRNILEQMIQSARQQAIAPQQMQYRVMYQ